jgi:hypothetical protein
MSREKKTYSALEETKTQPMCVKERETYSGYQRDGNVYWKEIETYNVFERDRNLQWISKRWKITMYLKDRETKNVFKRDGNLQCIKRHGNLQCV